MSLNDKNKAQSVILGDFVRVLPPDVLPQDLASQLLALGIAKTKCMESGKNSDEELIAVIADTKAKFEYYAVSPKYIKHRRCAMGLSNYSNIKTQQIAAMESLLESGIGMESFLESGIHAPLYHDLIKNNSNPRGLHIGERMDLFEKTAMEYIEEMYKDEDNAPDDIIHVTTSGYTSPSAVERFVSKKGWINTTITNCYHMACYGSSPGIRMAHGFMASSLLGISPPKSRIDIVHTEISSAHSSLSDDSAEKIITMTLFGDGFIRYSAFSEEEAERRQLKGMKILALKENLLPDSSDELTWKLGPHNFEMTLSLKVPYIIRDNVKRFVDTLLNEVGIDFDREKENLAYAIHPGGPAIIKKVCEELGLTDKQLELSNKVFYENGNISSCTVPYILEDIIDSDHIPAGTAVLSLAFGPGMTISGMVLEKV